jgi:hypothetical protein
MKRDELRRLTRDELLARAEALGVGRPAVLTQAELIDEIVKRTGAGTSGMRGWLGRARDLVAQVVSKGLHLPDAAKLFRGEPPEPLPAPPPPLPTVTLAEIYAAQGHVAKAVSVLEQVLEREPTHELAKELRGAFEARVRGAKPQAAASADPGHGPLTPTEEPLDQTVENDSCDETPLAALTLEPTVAPMSQTVGGDSLESFDEMAPLPVEREPLLASMPQELSPASVDPTTLRATPRAPHSEPPALRFEDTLLLEVNASHRTRIAWSLRPVRLARLQATRPEGALVVRLFSVAPTATGLSEASCDIAVQGVDGEIFASEFASGSQVRCCLAWKDADAFVPLVVGSPSAATTEHLTLL